MKELKDFMKSNKTRRELLAKKAGFKNAVEYLAHLKGDKKIETPKQSNSLSTDIVIAFDTTGSMVAYIASVKKHVKELIPELFSKTPNLKVKIVAFGDYSDMNTWQDYGKAYQESQLTDNQQELISFVTNAKDTGGGDSDEFYELVIKKITEETPWREGNKSVLFIGDAKPHSVGYKHHHLKGVNTIDWEKEAHKAKEKGIQFDTIKIIANEKWYKQLSDITGGICMNFKNSNKISEVITASTYARGSKVEFNKAYSKAVDSKDDELIGVYKSLSKLL